LKASVNPYQSRPARASRPAARALLLLAREDLRLVVQRLEAARSQDRLAQPLEPECEEQPADDQAEDIDRDQRQRRPECAHDRRERDGRGPEARERGAPAPRDARGEDDGQRLDELDRAREERRCDQEAGRHLGGSDEIEVKSRGRAGRRAAASSVVPIVATIGTPCVLASRRPSHPLDEHHSVKPS